MTMYKIVVVHGEGGSVWHVVNANAPEEDQPAIVASFQSLDEAERWKAQTERTNP